MCCDEKDLHALEPNMGLLVLILNIVCGTLGSLIYAFLSPNVGRGLIVWFLQSFTCLFFGAGWIWALVYGYRIYRLSVNTALKSQGGYVQQPPQ